MKKVIETIKKEQGITWHWSLPVPTAGYVVSLGKNFGDIVSASILDNENEAGYTLSRFVERNDYALERGNFMGAWIEGKKLYLDIVEIVESENEAVKLGRERDQIAIWDIANGVEILTGGTGEL